jgi:xanthine/uracil permease
MSNFRPDEWLKFMLVVTVPVTFVLILVGVTVRERTLDPVVSGGMLTLLGAIVAAVTVGNSKGKDKDEPEI